MEVKASHIYGAPLDQVVAMLRDEKAAQAKYEGMGHRDVQITESEGDDASWHMTSTRVVDVDLPGFAKKVLKPTNTMTQRDDWRRSGDGDGWDGTFDVEVKGAPIHLSGRTRLAGSGNSTTHEVVLNVEVKVPLIGGRIADWAAKNDVRRTLDAEFAFGDEWLAHHGAAD